MSADKPDIIPTNLRLLLVIEQVAKAGSPVTPTEVNAVIGLPKPTIHRLFATLEDEGFVQRALDGRGYYPGPRLQALAGGVLSTRGLRVAQQAILQRLSQSIGETCNIARPDRDAMAYIDRVETEWPLRIQLPIGTRVPLHCTASGKMYLSSLPHTSLVRLLDTMAFEPHTPNTCTRPDALMAELDTIRREGRALDREEFMQDMIALAVPISDSHGRLMATLSFHAPTQRFDVQKALGCFDLVQAAAADLGALVAGTHPAHV